MAAGGLGHTQAMPDTDAGPDSRLLGVRLSTGPRTLNWRQAMSDGRAGNAATT
jgi:hypothetical protein